MAMSYCKHGLYIQECRACAPKRAPDYTDGRGIAHASADVLARFSMNLPRIRLADLLKKPK